MKLSIIIPVYNSEKYIEECINSVIKQNYKDCEIILVDDGSTDNCGNICDRYKQNYNNIIKVKHKKNGGLLSARRTGIEMARGEYCISLDSDDILAENSLSEISAIIEKHKPDFVLYDLMYFDEHKMHCTKINDNCLKTDILIDDLDILKNGILNISFNNWSMCAKCIKTSILKEKFDYSDYYTINYGEDTLQSIIVYNKSKTFVYTDKCIYFYRMESGMTKKMSPKYLEDFKRVSNFMRNNCKEWSKSIEEDIDKYWTKTVLMFASNVIYSSKNYKEVRKRFKEVEYVNEKLLFNTLKTEGFSKNDKMKIYLLKKKVYFPLFIKSILVRLKNYGMKNE